jgi:hypothetical protein
VAHKPRTILFFEDEKTGDGMTHQAFAPRTDTNYRYPETIEAALIALNRERNVGQTLFKECGGKSGVGKHDGSRAKVTEARAEFIEVQGNDDGVPSVEVWCRWKNIAEAFAGQLDDRLPWSAREAARTPERLKAAISFHPAGTEITRDRVREALKVLDAKDKETQRRARLAEARAAEAAADDAISHALPDQYERALKRHNRAIAICDRLEAATEKRHPRISVRALGNKAQKSTSLAGDVFGDLEGQIAELKAADRQKLREESQMVLDAWQGVLALIDGETA